MTTQRPPNSTLNVLLHEEENPIIDVWHDDRRYSLRISYTPERRQYAFSWVVIWPSGSIDSCLSETTFKTRDLALVAAGGAFYAGVLTGSSLYPFGVHTSRIICKNHEEHENPPPPKSAIDKHGTAR